VERRKGRWDIGETKEKMIRERGKITRIAVSACHYIKTSPTLDGLYSSIDNFKLRRSEPDPFIKSIEVSHPSSGWTRKTEGKGFRTER
jgi:hypothetical protein